MHHEHIVLLFLRSITCGTSSPAKKSAVEFTVSPVQRLYSYHSLSSGHGT